ncbi:MAG: glycosyltransferase [Bacteroidota bacterium]
MEVTGIFTGILLILLAGYGCMILSFTWGLYKLHDHTFMGHFPASPQQALNTSVSVIIPVRNEIRNITRILDEMRLQDYPVNLMEVIVTDDFSEDYTCAFVDHFIRQNHDFPLKLVGSKGVQPGETGKKKAIERALRVAHGDLIIGTDADTYRGIEWISAIVAGYEKGNAKMLLGPVAFCHENNLLQKVQSVEFIGLMGVTAGSASLGLPVMCNGANLAYPAAVFRESGGFNGNMQFSSGDDQFLMAGIIKKFGRQAVSFQYDPSAIVRTEAESAIAGFINQRLRWVSKGRGYKDPVVVSVAMLTYLIHFSLLGGMLSGFWLPQLFIISLFLWLIKILMDYPLVFLMARFLGKRDLLGFYFISQVFQLMYLVVVGAMGLIFPFHWKGRKKSR